MRKLVAIVHISLDGFVGGAKGEFDGFIDEPEHLNFVCGLTDNADTALFGRISYQLLDAYWPTAGNLSDATADIKRYSSWFKNVSKYVMSTTLKPDEVSNATVVSNRVAYEIQQLKEQEGSNILIFGSPRSLHFLREQNLIDEYWILLHPVLFGEGIPLFRNFYYRTSLALTRVKHFKSGLLALCYEVK